MTEVISHLTIFFNECYSKKRDSLGDLNSWVTVSIIQHLCQPSNSDFIRQAVYVFQPPMLPFVTVEEEVVAVGRSADAEDLNICLMVKF